MKFFVIGTGAHRKELCGDIKKLCEALSFTLEISEYEQGEDLPLDFDAAFIDISACGDLGIKTARGIIEANPGASIILASNDEGYAIEGFEIRAFDYILKPYSPERLQKTLFLFNEKYKNKDSYITIKERRLTKKINIDEILYADYNNHYIYIHGRSDTSRAYIPFAEFSEMLLCYPRFLYCYRNCLVNMDKISKIERLDFLLENGERTPIFRKSHNEVKQKYLNYKSKSAGDKL